MAIGLHKSIAKECLGAKRYKNVCESALLGAKPTSFGWQTAGD